MNMLFYYDELYHAAVERINKLVDLSVAQKNILLQRLQQTPFLSTTTEDIELVTNKILHSLGAVLCPEAYADYAGNGKLLEMEMLDNGE
ncbi:hypothetical protein SAMN05660909_00285 [Chitinophaga terrae (ex Kim and Jung 2007)]|jgi:hypothetical protein|uniref:Uncharacterized protein n=1 Tax=Chitinophaga terrae (ex Kim and Jung 2007) TaxID=408074 RepID=A0A1H3X648_9BACT|nr:hypothetical protein [Chitinophaga terrae (ex Kim and Jung 2007)]MDQ0106863.1 hypothetical protein [Chitinophaga terrae (ex Kim and Jung 2007)]SDZ94865.1 hypothetical protein SAMN05660909_00285 [Chitinophaga terrae (ex Kim and Jung 2007)]